MNGGNFVKTLFSLGYPDASSLKPRDFDWMFDDTPDTQEFLRFICSLGAQNVLSDEEDHFYRALLESGMPILTEVELDKLERLERSVAGLESNENGCGGEGMDVEEDDDDDDVSLEELQQQLDSLRRQKRQGHQRLLHIQNAKQQCAEKAFALSAHSRGNCGDETNVSMTKALAKENVATNVVLRNLQGEVRKLQSLMTVSADAAAVETQPEYLQLERPQSQRSAALLSQLPLDAYLQEVRPSHQRVADHYKNCFTEEPQKLSDDNYNNNNDEKEVGGEEDDEEKRIEGDDGKIKNEKEEDEKTRKAEGGDGKMKNEKEKEEKKRVAEGGGVVEERKSRELAEGCDGKTTTTTTKKEKRRGAEGGSGVAEERKSRELTRLQAAAMSVQELLVQARAEEAGAMATKLWLTQQQQQQHRGSGVEPSSFPLSSDDPVIPSARLLSLLHRHADGLCLPVLWEDARQWAERMRHICNVQRDFQGALLHQQAQLQLLQALLGAEQRAHAVSLGLMAAVVGALRMEAARASEGVEELGRRQDISSGTEVSVKEPTVKRLLELFESPEEMTTGFSDCLSDLAGLSSAQKVELKRLAVARGGAEAEVRGLMRSLETESDTLRQVALSDEGHAQLCPQVVGVMLREAEGQVGPLLRRLQELVVLLSSRRSQLQRSAALRQERELYAIFHLDPTQLGRVLEDCQACE